MYKIKILFVCLGNICRSPLAKVVFSDVAEKHGLGDKIEIDSCGLHNYHEGEDADERSVITAKKHGHQLIHTARKIKPADFHYFDMLIAMDSSNITTLNVQKPRGAKASIYKFRKWDKESPNADLPDPYYGGMDGFEKVYQMCLRSSEGLVEEIKMSLL